MRVIAGSARSLPLKTLDTSDTRPTQDRIKETLFNILHTDLPGSHFLDLFAGSGAIGIEALSRGAKKAWFIENNPKAVAMIRHNLEFTRLSDKAEVMTSDVIRGLSVLEALEQPVDLIFMDPPYRQDHEKRVLEHLSARIRNGACKYVDSYTRIIVEAALGTDFSYLSQLGFELDRQKRYKTNQHVFIRLSRL